MKVRLLTSVASPAWSYAPGEIAEFPPDEAARLIEKGFAEPVRSPIESARIEPAETATRPRTRSRKPR